MLKLKTDLVPLKADFIIIILKVSHIFARLKHVLYVSLTHTCSIFIPVIIEHLYWFIQSESFTWCKLQLLSSDVMEK